MERDFQDMAEQIADLVYWLTKSYSKTIERQLRQLAPFLSQFDEGIMLEGTDIVINPYEDDEDVDVFVQAVDLASSLYALGDFHSVQRAQILLLALPSPERRTVRNRKLWIEPSTTGTYRAASRKRGSYRSVTYTFYGVGGNLV